MRDKPEKNHNYVIPLRVLIISFACASLMVITSCPRGGSTVLEPIPRQECDEGLPISFLITATDSDDKAVRLSNSYLNDGMKIEKTGHNECRFTWPTDYTDAGLYTIKLIAHGSGRSNPVWAHVKVNDVDIGPVGTYFESSFETATGKSDEAVLDGGKWDYHGGILDYIEVLTEVVTSYGTIKPKDGNGANMLSIGGRGTEYENIIANKFIRSNDEHTYLRFYMNVIKPENYPDDAGPLHGIQDLCMDGIENGSTNVYAYHTEFYEDGWYTAFFFRPVPGDTNMDYYGNNSYFGMEASTGGGQFFYNYPYTPVVNGFNGKLDYHKWYRFEEHIQWLGEHTSATPAIFEIRIYDETNTLVIDNNTIYTEYYDGDSHSLDIRSLNELYSFDNNSEGRRFYINALHRCIMFGVNGNGMNDIKNLYLIDKVAFSNEGWIGG